MAPPTASIKGRHVNVVAESPSTEKSSSAHSLLLATTGSGQTVSTPADSNEDFGAFMLSSNSSVHQSKKNIHDDDDDDGDDEFVSEIV